MSTQSPVQNTEAFANDDEKAKAPEMKNHKIESVGSVDLTNDTVAASCNCSNSDASEDADAEMSWLAKVFDPNIQKVERWEEDWDTASESESSSN